MNEEINNLIKSGKIEVVEKPAIPTPQPIPAQSIDDYIPLLEMLKTVKRHRTTAPTNIPRNLLEQFELYDDGTNFRLYFYINKTWRFVALT